MLFIYILYKNIQENTSGLKKFTFTQFSPNNVFIIYCVLSEDGSTDHLTNRGSVKVERRLAIHMEVYILGI